MDYCTTPDADFWLRVEDALRRLDDNTLDECATAALAAFHSHPSAAFTLIPLEEWASCSLHDILRCTFEATRRGTTQPEKQSHRYVAACIYACDMFGGTAGGTMACMAQLALFWTAYVYWPRASFVYMWRMFVHTSHSVEQRREETRHSAGACL